MKDILKKWWLYLIILVLIILCIINVNILKNKFSNMSNNDKNNVTNITNKAEITFNNNNEITKPQEISNYPNIEKICKDYSNILNKSHIDIDFTEFEYSKYAENTYYNTMTYYTKNQDYACLKFDEDESLLGITLSGHGENASKDYLNMRLATISYLDFSESEEKQIINMIAEISTGKDYREITLKKWKITAIPDSSIIRTFCFSIKE